jgi:hypothetical protein
MPKYEYWQEIELSKEERKGKNTVEIMELRKAKFWEKHPNLKEVKA